MARRTMTPHGYNESLGGEYAGSRASHMHAAVNNRLLAVWGLLNLLTQFRDLQRST